MKQDDFLKELETKGWSRGKAKDKFLGDVECMVRDFSSGFFNDGCILEIYSFYGSYVLKYEKYGSYETPKIEHQIWPENVEEFYTLIKVLGYDKGL